MGKASKAQLAGTVENTQPSVSNSLNNIIKTEARINAEIEQVRLEAHALVAHAQEGIPDVIEHIEHEARTKAEDAERRIAQESAMKIASIREEGQREAVALHERLDENFEAAVDYVVKQVTQRG